ncbi:MAG: ATP-binding protein [Planctomycetales bacterium]|nr:ATP-binding protein [Planctomycetales bacterium]
MRRAAGEAGHTHDALNAPNRLPAAVAQFFPKPTRNRPVGLLHQIQSGRSAAPPRMLIYGTEGVGKSTLASQAPTPIFVQTEDGLGEIDCRKFPLSGSLADVQHALEALRVEEHPFQSVVIDSLDWLERLIWDAICDDYGGAKSIEKVDGGYGKGYVYALAYWRQLLAQLADLHRQRSMAVLLIAHAKVEKFDDPESSPYDRYSPRLHKHAAALVTEWCDAVLFATRKFRTQTEETGFGRKRTTAHAIGKDGGERILRTIGGPACVAKNRYGLDAELPLDCNALLAGITASGAAANN